MSMRMSSSAGGGGSGSNSAAADSPPVNPRTLALYYARCGFSRTLITLCDDILKKRGNDAQLIFWRAFGYAREGNFAAALRDCDSLRGKKESEYAGLVASLHYQRSAKLVDKEAIAQNEENVGGKFI